MQILNENEAAQFKWWVHHLPVEHGIMKKDNLVEQDSRNIKRCTRLMLRFKSFRRMQTILSGIEVNKMICKGYLQHLCSETSSVVCITPLILLPSGSLVAGLFPEPVQSGKMMVECDIIVGYFMLYC